jgi:hypothetical protein
LQVTSPQPLFALISSHPPLRKTQPKPNAGVPERPFCSHIGCVQSRASAVFQPKPTHGLRRSIMIGLHGPVELENTIRVDDLRLSVAAWGGKAAM